jgi:transcriptional regulator with XRE-family HTH domain
MQGMNRAKKKRRGGIKGRPNLIDVHVGERLRQRRVFLGMSQEKLGEAIGLPYQQVSRYERGANRIAASRLYDLCRVLDVPVGYFFEDLPEEAAASSPRHLRGDSKIPIARGLDPMAKHETLELARAYYRISDPKMRKRMFELVKAVASSTAK